MIENSILKDLNRECGKIRKRLEEYGGHPIRLVEDDSVSFGGDVEYCLTHHRYENVIRYNPDDYADSLLHGLLRLEMAIDNTIAGRKKAIFTRQYHRERFHQRYGKEIRKLHKDEKPFIVKGMEIVTYDTHIRNLVETVMNLLVMERQYQEYPAFRNLQRKRAEGFLQEEIDVLSNTEYRGIIPKRCEQVDKIQNLVYAMHLCDLFGVNLLEEFFPSKDEMNHAKDLYEEFKACCRFFEPGKEYELLEYFALSLGMEKLFDIGDEPKEDIRLYSGYDDDESTFERLYEEYLSPERKEMPKELAQVKMAQFILKYKDGEDKEQTDKLANFMVEASETFIGMSVGKIANIAIESAALCTKGISPDGHYSLTTLPGRDFEGWHLLAYMYISLRIISPDFLERLKLPFETAYRKAGEIFEKRHG